MGWIVTVTPNPAVDKTLLIPFPRLERVVRVLQAWEYPSGKGVNVARVLHRRGFPVVCLGFVGGPTGEKLIHLLKQEGLHHDFTLIEGETRVSITIRDPESQLESHLVEPGPVVREKEKKQFLDCLEQHLENARLVALCGSLPPGLEPDFYQKLVKLAQSKKVPVALDSSGDALKQGLLSQPDIIKPNRQELSELVGSILTTDEEVSRALIGLTRRGIRWATASLGRDGIIGTDGDQSWKAVPPLVTSVNTIGSGDAALAGIIEGWLKGQTITDALRLAATFGTANALIDGPGYLEEKHIKEVDSLVQLTPLTL
ncbi:MAG: 1-phosphofructokinase family hexose kinase [Armatimonadetes bacterium]|nr:1-phosphofructokinase family hexose kinase [Armatimonadota bacterium]MDW8122469.1 1-phosphofructokinase family hexose kinase [Armatimonadota bacterium]